MNTVIDAHDFTVALEGWIDNLTLDERRAYAAGLGVDPDGDAFDAAMAGLFADHLCSDPFERDPFPAPPKSATVHPIFAPILAAIAPKERAA